MQSCREMMHLSTGSKCGFPLLHRAGTARRPRRRPPPMRRSGVAVPPARHVYACTRTRAPHRPHTRLRTRVRSRPPPPPLSPRPRQPCTEASLHWHRRSRPLCHCAPPPCRLPYTAAHRQPSGRRLPPAGRVLSLPAPDHQPSPAEVGPHRQELSCRVECVHRPCVTSSRR